MKYQVYWDEEASNADLPYFVEIPPGVSVGSISDYLAIMYNCDPVAIESAEFESIVPDVVELQDSFFEDSDEMFSSIEYDYYSESFWNALNKNI